MKTLSKAEKSKDDANILCQIFWYNTRSVRVYSDKGQSIPRYFEYEDFCSDDQSNMDVHHKNSWCKKLTYGMDKQQILNEIKHLVIYTNRTCRWSSYQIESNSDSLLTDNKPLIGSWRFEEIRWLNSWIDST